jgi:alanyl-tRNA synthetase
LPDADRLYYSDSFLKAFTATVDQARELPGGGQTIWQISLDRSAFYPSSGGQPFDTGILTMTSPAGSTVEVPVEQVEEDESTVWHFVRQQLSAGAQVEGHIDWQRRFDHMQQHTGQHLLSAIFSRELQAPTVSFHLGESTSTIDLTSGAIGHHSLERVERIANEIIGEDRPVTASFVSRLEAESMLATGDLRKLPDRQGSIRLITMADLDRNACGGTHVRSTGQIGGLLIRGVEKVSRGIRIEFVCGLRAVRAARADAAILTETAGLLSTGAPELPGLIKQILAESKASAKERQKLREELATYQAAELVMKAPLENGLRLIVGGWKDRDREFIRLLASRAAAAAPSTVVFFCVEEADPVRVFLARSPDLKFNCGVILREALTTLGLRGGGSPELAQGEVPAKQEPNLRSSVINAIRRAVADHEQLKLKVLHNSSDWETHLYSQTAVLAIERAKVSFVKLHCPVGNRQSNAESARLRAARLVNLVERPEDRFDLLVGNTRSVVAHLYARHFSLSVLNRSSPDLDGGSLFSETDRVANHIFDRAIDQFSAADNLKLFSRFEAD